MIGFVLSRILGVVRLSIQAGVFRVDSPDSTAFTTAIALPDLVFTIISGGALASSFIPVFAGKIDSDDEESAWRIASGVLNGVLIVLVVALVIAEFAAPIIVVQFMKAPPDPTIALTRVMLLQPLFLAVTGILMGIYNSYHRFIIPAIAPLIYNAANIVGLLLVPVFHHLVILAAWGVTIGAFLQVVILLPGLRRFWQYLRPGRGLTDSDARVVARLMIPRVIGQAAIQFAFVVTVGVANADFADNPIAAIRLGWNLMSLPVGIIGSASAMAAFPTMSRLAARGDTTGLANLVTQSLRSILFLALPAMVGLALLRHPLAVVIFRHAATTEHGIDLIASSVLLWAIGVPALALIELLPRVFFALKDTWTPVLVNLVTLATAIILTIIGGRLAHGNSIIGVAVLSGVVSLTVLMEVVWLGALLIRRLQIQHLSTTVSSALRSVVAAEAMGLIVLSVRTFWYAVGTDTYWSNVGLLVVTIPVACASYAGCARLVHSQELTDVLSLVSARIHPRSL